MYGLPELHRNELKGAALVATPGCYVTAATLALRPLVEEGLIETTGVIVDAASGVTGAGRKADYAYGFTTIDENFAAYGLLDHRHTPEMEQEIGAQLLFTPHLAPMNRGILATCYARPSAGADVSTEALLDLLRARWRDEPFMVVTDASPSTKSTLGSNAVHVTARYDARTGTVVAIAALDNLAKGASGGAVQAANVALGLDEQAGLTKVGVAAMQGWPDRCLTSPDRKRRCSSRRCRTSGASPARSSWSSTEGTRWPAPPSTMPWHCSPRTSC